MQSSIRISRGGRSITFRGGAARAAFEGMTGTKLPPAPKKMDPNRFTIGERVGYVNHVTGEDLGVLEIVSMNAQFIEAKRFFDSATDPKFKFHLDGRATWSSNLSIRHA